jgi:hypothetical protein
VNVDAPIKFKNQVGHEIAFTIEDTSLTKVNAELEKQLTSKGVQKLSDTDFNELNKLMGTNSYVSGFKNPSACVMDAARVWVDANKDGVKQTTEMVCPPAEADTVAAAWNSKRIANVNVSVQMASSSGEVAKRDIAQNSSVPLYADAAEAEAAVAGSSADSRPAAPVVALSTANVTLGANYTINWTDANGACPANMVRSFKVYENNVLVRTQSTLGYTKNYTNSATEFLNYNVQIECVRGALVVSSDMSAVATAKVIPAVPALVINTQPAVTNAPLNSNLTSTATCLYGTTPRYNIIQAVTTYGTPNTTVSNVTSVNRAINNGFTVVEGARYQYRVEAWCNSAFDKSTNTTANTNTFTTLINTPATGAPVFTSPVEGATNVATNVTVAWSAATCATGTTAKYYSTKDVNAGATISAQVIDNWTTDRSLVSNNTQGNTVGYSVQARCDGTAVNSAVSPTDSVKYTTVINTPVGAPMFTSPAEGATNVATNATVAWSAPTCAPSTAVQYYTTKNIDANAAITAQVIDNWTTGNTLASSNTQGNTVGYTVAARCAGPNAVSGATATDTVKYTTAINAPTVPSFTSPAEGATNIATNATVTWSVVTCPTGTTVQYYTTKNINAGAAITPVVIDNWTAGNTLASNNTQGNTVGYTVAARCVGPNATSASSATDTVKYTTSITAPTAPLFTSPTEGATGIAPNATVSWSVATCSTGTTVQYFTTKNINNGAGITPIVIDNWTAGNTLASSNNEGSTVGYTVAARCVGPNATSGNTATDTVKYTTLVSVPDSPSFTTPANGDIDVSLTKSVQWSGVGYSCAAGTVPRYYMRQNKDEGVAITSIVLVNWASDLAYSTSNTEGNKVGYAVQARCEGPNAVSSSTASVFITYTTLVNAPVASNFTSPSNGAVNVTTDKSLQWSGVGTSCGTGTVPRYYVQKNIDGGVAMTTPEVLVDWASNLSYLTSNDEGNTVGYTVNARCVGPNAASKASPTDTITYTTVVNAPSAPLFTSPAEGATNVATNATVSWSAVTCGPGTSPRYYSNKYIDKNANITPIVYDNWTTDRSLVSSNKQGYIVGYAVAARCVGANATSGAGPTDTVKYTTLVNAPSAVTADNNDWSTVTWSAPATKCAAEAPIAYRIYQTKSDNNAVNVYASWTTGTTAVLPATNTGGYPQWASVQAYCNGANADSTITSGANTTKWVKMFDVSFSATQAWRRINVWGSCPVSTTVDSFNLYVAADGWNGARGVYGGIYTDEGALIADAQPGPGSNTGWINLMQNVNSRWNDTTNANTTHQWGYWGAGGLGAAYSSRNISATYWNASGWGAWGYWWTGSCETPYMIVYDKGAGGSGGTISNVGSPGTRYTPWLQRGSLKQAGVDAIR